MPSVMISLIPGIILCLAIGAAAFLLSAYLPLGAVTLAIIIGILIGNFFKPGDLFAKGIMYSEKKILSFAIALMGINLDFAILKELGLKSLALVVAAMIVTIGFSLVAARLFRLDRRFALLLGIGNGVCGSSAIAATKHIIGADKEEAGVSIAIVNFLGTLGIFALPFLASGLLGLSEINSGFLIGNTLQAVGQVAAAGFAVGETAGQTATIIKMSRILMLFPLIIVLLLAFARERSGNGDSRQKRAPVPLFIIGFALFSLIPTFDLLPESSLRLIGILSKFSLVTAMSAIGLKILIGNILNKGKSAFVAGSLIFLFQIFFNSAVIFFIFQNM